MKPARAWVFLTAVIATICASCSREMSGPDQDPRPILGSCNVEPNYISQVRLNRWRDFPLRYFVAESLFPAENRDQTLPQIVDGVNRWGVSTNGRIGSLTRISSPDGADFIVVAEVLGAAGAARTTHTTGTPFLSGGRIGFDRQTLIALSRVEDTEFLPALAAHEMGHLLGIIGHPVMPGVLMTSPLQALEPTMADVNTMMHAYCR